MVTLRRCRRSPYHAARKLAPQAARPAGWSRRRWQPPSWPAAWSPAWPRGGSTGLAVTGLADLSAGTASASPLPGAPGCEIFPPDNVWNTPVNLLPVDPHSAQYIAAIGPGNPLHPDFGQGDWDGEPMGIPYNVVPGTQPKVPVSFMYASESNPGPYPIPRDAQIEGGPSSTGDRHVIVVDTGNCTDYEMWASYPKNGGASWQAGSGAIFPLDSNKLRPATWTSADAAGPAHPARARRGQRGQGRGASTTRISVTVPCTDTRFIWPARHEAGQDDPNCPPMGLRLRLKASVDISQYPRMDRVILQALKTYGMIVADNGSAWFISGAGTTTGTTAPCTSSTRSRAPISRWSTSPASKSRPIRPRPTRPTANAVGRRAAAPSGGRARPCHRSARDGGPL